LIRKLWTQHKDSLLLIHTGEVKQVTVLPKTHRTVSVGWHYIIRIENDNGIRLEVLNEIFSVVDKKLLINLLVAHIKLQDAKIIPFRELSNT
jgi:hypothetical protein